MTDNKLKLDEELVIQLLSEDNITEADDTNQDIMLERIKDHFDFEITDGYEKHADIMFYTETTSDGYEVWIATDDDRHPSIWQMVRLFIFKILIVITMSFKKLYTMFIKSTTMTNVKS